MKYFFYPLLRDLKRIYDEGGIKITRGGSKHTFIPFILSCNVDLPAKADVQEIIGHNGYYGCGYCLHPGESVKANPKSRSHVKFTNKDEVQLRTHQDFLAIYEQLRSSAVKGVKAPSCMIGAIEFDLANGFSIDYMHCVLLGVMRKLLGLWLDFSDKSYFISKQKQAVLNKRIISIKPIMEITRKPRSLSDRADFKANEFRSLLLYYLPNSLVDLLPMRYIIHFRLLSSATYMLLKETVSHQEINEAEERMNKFVEQFEEFYGKYNMTMNVHLLRHISNSVRHVGPLWCQSTFGFETNNGNLVHSRNSKKDILHQITWKYCMKFDMTKKAIDNDSNVTAGGRTKMASFPNGVFAHIAFRGKKFTSKISKNVSTIDFFFEVPK